MSKVNKATNPSAAARCHRESARGVLVAITLYDDTAVALPDVSAPAAIVRDKEGLHHGHVKMSRTSSSCRGGSMRATAVPWVRAAVALTHRDARCSASQHDAPRVQHISAMRSDGLMG